jgi:hypothetical protein
MLVSDCLVDHSFTAGNKNKEGASTSTTVIVARTDAPSVAPGSNCLNLNFLERAQA